MRRRRCDGCRSSPSVRQADSKLYVKTHQPFWYLRLPPGRNGSRCHVVTFEESEIPLPLTIAHIRKRASLTVGVTAVAVGLLTVVYMVHYEYPAFVD